MKKGFLLMSVILTLALVFTLSATFVNAAANFKVTDLSISPTFVTAGSSDGTITISIKVINTGTEAGTYKAELKINDAVEATKDIALEPGKEQKIMFPVAKTEVGEYTVVIEDLKGVFSVAPAGLEVKNLLIDPLEASPDKEVVISVTVQNKSTNQPLTYDSLKLFINGTVKDKKRIDLKAGESTTISFNVTEGDVGNYVVQIGSKTGTFIVKASFFSSLPTFIWIIIGVIVLIIIIMVVMILTAPKKKKRQVTGKPGRPIKGPPLAGAVQPIAVQPPFGQQIPPYPGQTQQQPTQMTPPYPGQPQQMPPQAIPHFPGQQQQMPPRTTMPPFPGQAQQPLSPQQAPPYPGQTQQQPIQMTPPYPGQPQQMPPQAIPHFPGQQQQMPPRTTMPPFPGQAQQPLSPQQAPPYHGQQQMPSAKPEQFGMPPAFTPGVQPGFGQPPFGMPGRHVPQFTVSNLTITPQQIKEGDPINISAVVTNSSATTAQYSMVLRIGGVVENISEMTLNPSASQTALFTVTRDVPGDYYVEVDGQRGIFTVTHRLPAAFNVTGLTITPDRAKQGEPIAISTIVTNTGETPGSYSVVLRIKGIAESIEEVELGPGRSQKVVFTITKDAAGFYPVSLEHLSGRFVVEMDWKG